MGWLLKCVGALFVMGGCGYMGWHQSQVLKRRIQILREMVQSLLAFKNLTGNYRIPLNIVFDRISGQMEKGIADFYAELAKAFGRKDGSSGDILWQETIEKSMLFLAEEDRQIIRELGCFIGVQDVKIQQAAVDDCMRRLQERIGSLERERPDKEKVYKVVSLTIGGFLVVLLF
ncbi:MAG: stage III sporulation protein AB [Lachnospiraceae bacterium]|nr:stage III sporulation protein AB [Lachnospiraceae bacterium]